jgi:outer membrane receptor protein involved in Fe transport
MNNRGTAAAFRFSIMTGASSAALLLAAAPAFAQDAAPENIETITVSSSRITTAGFDAPTPTTVVGTEQITKTAASNVFSAITQLPSLQGSTGTVSGNGGTSGGTNGLSSFGLRGLGTIRTLVLIDGQRVVPANVTGVADVSLFPQLLIQRVDVVTGGASASWGSDAVAGVVNFITDKKFEGFKANAQGGISTYGDNGTGLFQMAAGTSFAGGKGHIEFSAEYAYEQGVPAGGYGTGPGPNGRTWYNAPAILQRGAGTYAANSPQFSYVTNAQNFQFSKYGLITNGPMRGTAFGANGQPFAFQYGSGNNIANCISPFCVGGDTTGNVGNGTSLVSSQTRGDVFGRVSYDIAPGIEIYGTVNIATVASSNQPNPGAFKNANLQIGCDNPFLPASVATACATNAALAQSPYAPSSSRLSTAGSPYPTGSFQYGTANAIFPNNITVKPLRNQRRFVVGSDGAFNLFGKDWTYDTYFQHGENNTSIHVRDITLTPRYNNAIDAVPGPNGTVVCRNPVARAAGCVPLNIIGNVAPDASVMAYLEPKNGPYQLSYQRQEAFSASVNGSPFALWAGDVSVAFGAEYREEAYNVKGDPYGNGVDAATPYTADYPADPILNSTLGNNWYAGNFHNGRGNYHVAEAFIETVVPLINNADWGKADLDLGGRAAGYSTSGYAQTWKVGLTWATPVDGVKLRAIQSRDLRAPNLSELFAAPIVTNGTVIDRTTNNSVTILNQAVGNTNLKPETSQTTELGVVYQPSFLPGFSASLDYFRVAIKGQIAALNAQQIVDACQQQGNTAQCGNILLNSPTPNTNFVRVQSFNLASVVTDGFDMEASYQYDLADFDIPGSLTLRGLATRTMKFITNPGIPNGVILHTAGNNTGNIPLWKTYFMQSYDNDQWSFQLIERWFSDGVFNKNFIQCAAGSCPVSTAQNPTIDYNRMQGAFYLDIGGSYNISDSTTAYFKIDNITNFAPVPNPTGANGTPAPNSNGINPALYDTIGRMYRIGVRLKY